MEFRNLTSFPALAFEGIDQHGQSFHVAVLRQTLTFSSGRLEYAGTQAPLCEVDTFFGEMNRSSLRQESDLCQYKPKCDVIVNATAHAPQHKPAQRFEVLVRIKRADTQMAPPAAAQGLNPFTSPSQAEMEAWRTATAHAQRTRVPGAVLLEKKLAVTGERVFRQRAWPLRLAATLARWGTLGLVKANPWRLTSPQAFTEMPLRHEYAYGGECRVNAGDRGAKRIGKRIGKKHRLTPAGLAGHPDREAAPALQPVAHRTCEQNLVGRGFAEPWFLRASGMKSVPAPRIEHPDAPLSARLFWQSLRGKFTDAGTLPRPFEPAGLGLRAKAHPQRRALLGTVDEAFIGSDAWLPQDFDFAIWNCAPPDQQIDYLAGDERIELVNLCAPDAPGATIDAQGNTCLELALPGHACTLLMRMEDGAMFLHPMHIDSLLIEPEQGAVSLVWRAVIAKDADIRAVDLRQHCEFEAEFMQLIAEGARKQKSFGRAGSNVERELQHG